MSLESKISKNVFQGNGTTKTFSFTFRVWKEDQVLVYVGIGDETETDVTSTCTITLSENGGTVTFPTAPAVGMTIVITRNMPFIQEDQYITGARFDPHEIEDRLDQDCAERQQLLDGVERAVKVPVTSDKKPGDYMAAFWKAVADVLKSVGIVQDAEEYIQKFVAGIPIIKPSLSEVEAGPDGYYLVTGFGDAGRTGNDISNRVVVADGSTAQRTLGERAADVVNVRDFGAKGDGVTDDTEAIREATQVALSRACGVFFPAGRYLAGSVYQQSLLYGDGVLVLAGKDVSLPSCVSLRADVDELDERSEDHAAQIATLQTTKADKSELTTPFNFKGETTFSSLPSSGTPGDTYFVTDRGYNMSWTGSGWAQSSADLSEYTSLVDKCLQAYSSIIEEANMDSVCNGDIDNLVINRVYAIAGDTDIIHTPEYRVGGLYFPMGRSTEPRSATSAIFVTYTQRVYVRLYAQESWQEWRRLINDSEFSFALKGENNIITSDNMIEVCNGDADLLSPEHIYVIAAGTGMLNLPSDNGGSMMIYNRGAFLSAGATAIFISLTGEMFYRSRTSTTWGSWRQVADIVSLAPYVKGSTIITADNAQEICKGDIDELPSNSIYTVAAGIDGLGGLPVPGIGGCVFGLSRNAANAVGGMRLFHAFTGELFHGTRLSSGWAYWKNSVSHDVPYILGLGDSICYGARNSGKGFIGDLNFPYLNLAVSGTRLSSTDTSRDPIYKQLDGVGSFIPDVIAFDGGTNDYNHHVPLGVLPSMPEDSSETDTLLGGMQHTLYLIKKKFPFAQVFFVACHKMKYNGVYWPVSQNDAGYTQTDMVEAQKKLCGIFGVTVVDVFHESQLDTSFEEYLGDYEATPDSKAWCNIDGVHPLSEGYIHAYVPLLRKALISSTHK